MRIGSLFSGAGGLDMAVKQVFGGHTVWHSEIDKAASKVLAHRWADVPNLGDITAVDWAAVEPVDVLCGGFPCQDVSAAGKRAGIKDGTRSGLWAIFADAIDALRPHYVVIENVRGLLSAAAHRDVESDDAALGNGSGRPVLRAAGAVLGDLADLGYDAQWTTLAASAVGAPHRRERVFIVACAADTSSQRPQECGQPSGVGSPQSGIGSSQLPLRAVSGDEPGVALLPTPGTLDSVEKRTTHAGGNLTLQGAIVGVNPVDLERHSKAGRAVSGDDVALLPTPVVTDSSDSARHTIVGGISHPGTSLTDAIRLLPTPNASDASGGGQHPDKREGHSRQLIDYVLLCTPSASDGAGGKTPRSGGRIDEPLLGGQAREMDGQQWGKYAPAIAGWEQIVGPAPAPTEPNKNGNPRLSAAFSEWLMGWPDGWVTDPDIGISRNDQLKIVGNGVCPQQAVAALRYLLSVCEVGA